MKEKTSNKKTVITIAIIAVLLVIAIAMVVVFLKDRGTTEATADQLATNGEQTTTGEKTATTEQNQQNNEPQEIEQQSNEEVQNDETRDTEVDSTQTTTTSSTRTTTRTTNNATVATTQTVQTTEMEDINLGWSQTARPATNLFATEVVKPQLTSVLEVNTYSNTPGVVNKDEMIEYTITVTNNSADIDAKGIIVSNIIPEGTTFACAVDSNLNDGVYNEETNQVIWTVDVNKGETVILTLNVWNDKLTGTIENQAVVDGVNTNQVEVIAKDTIAPVITPLAPSVFEVGVDVYTYPEAGTATDNYDKNINFSGVNMHWYKANEDGTKGEEVPAFKWNTTLTDCDLGKYIITYDITDQSGNTGRAERVITLQDTIAPEWIYPASGTHGNPGVNIAAKDANFAYIEVYIQDTGKTYNEIRSAVTLLEEGTYRLTIVDKAGNRSNTIWVAVDKTAPVIDGVEDGQSYNKDLTIKAFDKFLTSVKITKDGKTTDYSKEITVLGPNNENKQLEKVITEEGTYTIEAIDKVGNKTTKTFTIDKTAPIYKTLGIARNKNATDTRDQSYAKTGDSVRVLVSFGEKLAVEPKVKINGVEYPCTYREQSSNEANSIYYYMTDVTITEEMNLPEGEIQFELYGYADATGNVGETLTNANINMERYPRVIYDKTAPEITVKDDSVGTDPYFSKISFKLHDKYNVREYEINGTVVPVTPNAWADANYQNIKSKLKEGKNVIKLRDMAGNETVKEFIIDTKAPEITVKEESKGTDPYYTEVSFKLHDENQVKEYEINGTVVPVTPNAWSDANYDNIKSYLKEGKNVIILRDMAGNEAKREFIIDRTAPEIIVKKESKGTDPYFREVSFQLHDENKVKEYEINGTVVPVTPNAWSDANYQNIKSKLQEGKNVIKLRDMAGNETVKEFIIDTKAPEITVKEDSVGNDPYYSKISFKLHDENKVKEYEINGKVVAVTPNAWSDANYDAIKSKLQEGKNVIILRDMAGNEVTKEFFFDNTPAVRTATNILVYGDPNENKEFYATVGDKILAYISFKEKLAHNPTFILINNGTEYEVDASLVTENGPDKNGKYVYQIIYDIKEDTSFVDGEITLKVTNLKDLYGNEIADETKPTNGHIVYFDKTAPVTGNAEFPLFILNVSDENHRKYIKNGQTLRVEANFDEELAENPVLTIGTGENTQTVSFRYREQLGKKFVYVADIKIDNTSLKLEDGTQIPFTVTNVFDKAGNTATFNNDNVTPYKDIYDQVTYDNTAPVYSILGIFNNTHYNSSEDVTIATTGDSIRVYLGFSEKLAVEPKVKINDSVEFDCTFREKSSSDTSFVYMTDFKITEEMNLAEGELQLQISGYEDAAGNVGKTLTNADINFEKFPKVVYDKTAPEVETLGILNLDHFKEGDATFANTGDTIRVYVSFKEKLATEPVVTFAGKTYTCGFSTTSSREDTFVYMKDINLTEEMNLPEGNLQFEVSGYADVAGNVGTVLTQNDTNYPGYLKVTYDKTAPEAKVTFSNNNGAAMTNKDVTVTLTANEAIQDIEGWTRVNETTFTKIYSKNGKYSVEIQDIAGNKSTINYEVKRIDKVAPEAKVTFSNDNGAAMTNEDVTVTITTNESIKDIAGWTRVEDKVYTKVYSENGKYSVEIEDKAGNKSTIKFEVKRIDREAPIITLSNKNTFEVGVDVYTYPEEGSVYDKMDKEIDFKKVNIEWYKANADGTKGEKVDNFEWNTTLKNRELGNYYIYYWVTDKAGNKAEAHRILTLQDTTAPVITLNGEKEIRIEKGNGEYQELGAVVTDNRDETIENLQPVQINWYSLNGKTEYNVEKVDVNKEGRYNIVYQHTDRAGKKTEVQRLVYVEDRAELILNAPTYTKQDDGTVLVTISANKQIKELQGWELSEDGTALSKKYTKNTDYLGEEVTITDLRGTTKKATVKVTEVKENGREVINVGSKESLKNLVEDINNGTSFANKTIKLTSDINLNGEKWTPIYSGSKNNVLDNAIIDGNSHKITGMTTSRDPYATNGSKNTPYGNGFISDVVGKLTIQNLSFENAKVIDPNGGTGSGYSQHYAGVLVGHSQGKLTINNVKVNNARVESSWQTGILVGYASEDVTFKNCKVSNSFVGGSNATAGTLFGLGVVNVTVENCTAENIKLYTDGLTWDSTQAKYNNFWVGHIYQEVKDTKLTVTNSTETNVTVVDSMQ